MTDADSKLHENYDRLWSGAIEDIRTGAISIDSVLASGKPDTRRGLSVMIRPAAEIRAKVLEFLDELRALEPEQHFYDSSELHVTFLSLFTATEKPEPFLKHAESYADCVKTSLCELAPFTLDFRGITASSGTIMIQGFGDIDVLNAARNRLRELLRKRGLAESLDQRYLLETAHMTVVRFQRNLQDGNQLARFLEEQRGRSFGRFLVQRLELVKNDWYLSRSTAEVLADYSLG